MNIFFFFVILAIFIVIPAKAGISLQIQLPSSSVCLCENLRNEGIGDFFALFLGLVSAYKLCVIVIRVKCGAKLAFILVFFKEFYVSLKCAMFRVADIIF